MSDSNSSLLRGAIQHSSVTNRVLYDSTNTDNASFFVFAASIVGLIGLCYLYCMFHVIRLWCCKPEGEAAVLVTDGFSFSLSARQRRAVLEAIFSDTSKAVTETMFFKENKGTSKGGDACNEDDIPHNITDTQTDSDSVDLEANSSDITLSAIPNDVPDVVLTPTTERGFHHEAVGGCAAPTDDALLSGSDITVPTPEGLISSGHRAPCEAEFSACLNDDLVLPTLEESKDEEGQVDALFSFASPNFVTSVSFRKDESEGFDDDEGENICAICLSGYKEGETIISSKYCEHVYHKECILEWLDNNDECPYCRVDMVTSGDVSKATATIVGRTRMVMAVESIRVRNAATSPSERRGVSPRARFGSR